MHACTMQIKSNTPILLCSVTGYDASGRVDDLAASQSKQCTSIAIGSSEGFSLAEKAISSASKSGRCYFPHMLNCHVLLTFSLITFIGGCYSRMFILLLNGL